MKKIPMTLEMFEKYMSVIQQDYQTQEDVYSASHHAIELFEAFRSLGSLVDLLSYVFNDSKNDWIGYFCWELDMGKKWHPGMVVDADGKDIPLSTVQELYQLLVNNFNSTCN